MLSLNDPMIKREIIMDHYENPRNKGLVDDHRYIKVNMNSEYCIDENKLYFTGPVSHSTKICFTKKNSPFLIIRNCKNITR